MFGFDEWNSPVLPVVVVPLKTTTGSAAVVRVREVSAADRFRELNDFVEHCC
jgi:hypothetical protein